MNNIIEANQLKRLRYFEGISPVNLDLITSKMRRLRFHRNDLIFDEGEESLGLYIVNSGKVKVYKTSHGGREHIFYYALKGDSFGETAIFSEEPQPVSTLASKTTEVFLIPTNHLKELVQVVPQLAYRLLEHFSDKMLNFMVMVENLSFKNVPDRLARILVNMVEEEGVYEGRFPVIRRDITVYELASLVGTVREVVTRSLQRLQNEGLIKISRRNIEILNLDGLKNY